MTNTVSSADTEFNIYKSWHWKMQAASNASRGYKREDEQFYFGDVDDTRTQFTKKQLAELQDKYDIPISTKLSYAIIEQMVALLTGTKPYPKLISASEMPETLQFTELYEKLVNATWFECEGNEEFALAVRDALMVGEGYLHVRKSNFYTESTFNVIFEYTPWSYVFIDPNSKKNDYSDAEMMCIAQIISKNKAEHEFDITIPKEDIITKDNGWGLGIEFGEIDVPYYTWSSQSDKVKDSYVWKREFYEKKNTWVYVSDTGDISSKRPKPTQIPNDEKIALGQQIEQLKQQMAQTAQQGTEVAGQVDHASAIASSSENPTPAVQMAGEGYAAQQEAETQMNGITEQLKAMIVKFHQMPDIIPAYTFVRLSGDEVTVKTYEKIKQKHIERTLCIGNSIYEKEILKTDEYPIIALNFSHNKSPMKVYSMTHFIKDIVKAMNKFWAITIYDAQLHGQRKVVLEESTVTDLEKWQNDYAAPGAVLTYKHNPMINDGGKPTFLEPAPLNASYSNMITLLQQLAEYITGMFALQQGNTQGSIPDTLGGIQSMQAAGGQRIKLYSRFFEVAMQRLTYVIISYLQQYCPRDRVLHYFDDNGDAQEIQMLAGGEDIRFKVRCQMTVNLPTTKLMSSQLLASISGQTKNPAVADLLTQYMLKNMDMPDATKMIQELDTVKQLTSQLQQAQMQLDTLQKKLNVAENNQFTSDLASKQKMAEAQIENEKERQLMEHQHELEQQTAQTVSEF